MLRALALVALLAVACGGRTPTTGTLEGELTFCEGGRDVGPCCCPRTDDPVTSNSSVFVGGFTDSTCQLVTDIPGEFYMSGEDADGCPIWWLENPPVGGLPEPVR